MGFILPGFPKEVTDKIEMPDIGELLCYPMFKTAEAGSYRKYCTEFQRYLLDRIPLKHDKKYVTVFSAVQLVYPGCRPITHHGSPKPINEWHIDALGEHDYQVPSERVHLLISHAEALTEFNAEEMDFQHISDDMPRSEFVAIWRNHVTRLGDRFKSEFIERDRIYTFQNHMHRPTAPRRLELRYTLRVRETNRPDEEVAHGPKSVVTMMDVMRLGAIPTDNVFNRDGKAGVIIPEDSLFTKGG